MSESAMPAPAPDGYPIKLVRDGTPAVINDTGKPGELFYGPLVKDADRLDWLRRKLGEEVTEYLLGGEYLELMDVLAVVQALCAAHGRSWTYSVINAENHPRGGFREGVMMYGRHPEFDGGSDHTNPPQRG